MSLVYMSQICQQADANKLLNMQSCNFFPFTFSLNILVSVWVVWGISKWEALTEGIGYSWWRKAQEEGKTIFLSHFI